LFVFFFKEEQKSTSSHRDKEVVRAVQVRDRNRCCITEQLEGLKAAHIIPLAKSSSTVRSILPLV
jgi:hypothetical protein